MNIKNKLYISSFLLLFGFMAQAAVDHTQQLQQLRQNITDQAEAIKQLTSIINNLKQKLGVAAETIQTVGIEPGATQLRTGGVIEESQELNTLITIAKNQSITLNKLADTVVRLQHKLGIQPEGANTQGQVTTQVQ